MITYKIKAGIYQWESIDNEKTYIGSTLHLSRRKSAHLTKLRKGVHENKSLQNTFNKYGEKRLEFSVLEFIVDTNTLLSREQYFIDTLRPIFNVCLIAGATRGVAAWNKGIPMPKSVIQKQIATKKSRTYETKRISEEHKKAISIKNTGRPKTEEQKRLHSEKLKGRPAWNKGLVSPYESTRRKSVVQLDVKGVFVKEFVSMAAAEKVFNRRLDLSNACKENRLRAGFRWKYKTDYE